MEKIRFKLNGNEVDLSVDPERTLLWVLRSDLSVTGVKYGCGEGLCGACTVLVNGEAIHACQTRIKDVSSQEVVTIEGLAGHDGLDPVQEAFIEHGAFQCGFCTPGMILKAHALLRANPSPTRSRIIAGMEENLCRCGAHKRIVTAVESASAAMKKGG